MQDKRKIKEIYNCISISSNEELYPLQKWYNQLIEKTIAEITVEDVLRMIRQKEFTNLAVSKAIIKIRGTATLLGNQDPLWVVDGIIQDDPIPIDLMTNMADDLKNIIKNALVKSETRDWIYAGEEEEFKDMIDTLSKKIM